MFNLLTITLGLMTTVLVGVGAGLVNADLAIPSVPLVFVVYAALHRDAFGALLTAFVLGTYAGIGFGEFRGVFLLSLLAAIAATRWARGRLPLSRRVGALAWVAVSTIVANAAFVGLGALLRPGLPFGRLLLVVSPRVALFNILLAVPVFLVLGWVEPYLRARQERTTLFSR